MNPISRISDDHRAVLFDLWGMLDLDNPMIHVSAIDWSVDTHHLGLVEKSNLLYDMTMSGLLKFKDKTFFFPQSTLNNINKFLFE